MDQSQDFLNKIYNCIVEELTNQINKKWKEQKQEIKTTEEEISRKISLYTEESYKQGFKDGMNLILNIFEKKS